MSKISTYYEKQRMQEKLARELEELDNDKEREVCRTDAGSNGVN